MAKKTPTPTMKNAKPKAREILQTEIGTQINHAGRRFPLVLSSQEMFQRAQAERESPFARAQARLYDLLNAACIDPVVVRSPVLQTYVHLVRELLMASAPGDRLEDILEPVGTLFSSMRGTAGGRPAVEDVWAEWRTRVERLKHKKPILTAQERYEEVAYDWEAERHVRTKWKAVRDGISELKKRGK